MNNYFFFLVHNQVFKDLPKYSVIAIMKLLAHERTYYKRANLPFFHNVGKAFLKK